MAAKILLFFAAALSCRAATIVLPANPTAEERTAAAELAHVWLKGTGKVAPIETERQPSASAPFFYVGETKLARQLAPLPPGLDADGARILVRQNAFVEASPRGAKDDSLVVILHGATPFATMLAVDWYAQHALGARWFQPGEIGEDIPPLRDWRPSAMDRIVGPAFLSRALEADAEWSRRNGLHARLPHGHALLHVFPPELFAGHPDWFPLLDGKRYRPSSPEDYNWQPNLALSAVADHAASAADEFFDRNPEAPGFSLSVNDSIRFDQSEATMKVRGPLRWFRGRPDYSGLVFGFMNRVADEVAPVHPDKLLCAYAYYWCENTPTFPVRPNIVPWLTADRSQYYDPKFEAEDHALIERWCRSGARIVGIYDYLEGGPFLIPRQTARMTAGSIQFAYGAGVRAFTAEGEPNWGLDGPKLWLAAQLLWDPHQSVDALLDDYYSRYWRESAGPMRRFDELCAQAWKSQPGPAWWLKYYNDETQAELFPPALRAELRGLIDDAASRARSAEVRARVARVSLAFASTEAFAAYYEARAAEKGSGRYSVTSSGLTPLRQRFLRARAAAVAAGAVAPADLSVYLSDSGGMEAPSAVAKVSAFASATADSSDRALLRDPNWRTVSLPATFDDRTFFWCSGPWWGRGEPWEGRSIRIFTDASSRRTLRFDRCENESFYQWVPASGTALYEAKVRFRGHVGPGSAVFLIVNWMDDQHRYVGRQTIDRVPPGDWPAGRELVLDVRSPAGTAYAAAGVCVQHETGPDFAEFSGLEMAER